MCTLFNFAVAGDFAYELNFKRELAFDPDCSSLAAAVGLTVISQVSYGESTSRPKEYLPLRPFPQLVFLFFTWYGVFRWQRGGDEDDARAHDSGSRIWLIAQCVVLPLSVIGQVYLFIAIRGPVSHCLKQGFIITLLDREY